MDLGLEVHFLEVIMGIISITVFKTKSLTLQDILNFLVVAVERLLNVLEIWSQHTHSVHNLLKNLQKDHEPSVTCDLMLNALLNSL